MSQTKIFKLIVQPTDNCLELLRYLDKNITMVNSLGVRIHIEKISKDEFDEDMVETLRTKGITRLPVLLAPDGKMKIGLKQVIDLFEKNINNANNNARTGPIDDAEIGTNPDMTDFWMNELYNGSDKRGRLIPRKDKDEVEEEGGNIEKRLAEYQRNVPKHRRTDNARERDIDPAPRTRGRGNYHDEDSEDNIADYEDEAPKTRRDTTTRLESTGDANGDDMDQRMLAAWMDNNTHES